MTLEQLQSRIDKLPGERKAYVLKRHKDPGPVNRRKNGAGLVEVWVKNSTSDGRWGGGPTLEAALVEAVKSLEWYEKNP